MEVFVFYQKWDEETGRPLNYQMNEREISFSSLADVPVVGDHIRFTFKHDGESGCYRVRSRHILTTFNPETEQWRYSINIVLEEVDNEHELVKS